MLKKTKDYFQNIRTLMEKDNKIKFSGVGGAGDFPGGPVVKTPLSMQEAWVGSLVGVWPHAIGCG